MKNWNAYHFVGDKLRDGRNVPNDGIKLIHEGEIELCRTGLHASNKLWDALKYAPGHTLCRVSCRGEIIYASDKLVCTERTIVQRINAEKLLFKFARMCALDVIDLWDAPPVAVEFLKTGNEELRDAAWDAARGAMDAARDAARDAAWDAAWAARGAMDAARDAAWAAVMAAAMDARGARDAARDAAWAARGARDVAMDAARDALLKKQKARLTRMVNAEFKRIYQ